MQKQTKYEKLLQLLEKRTIVTLEDCRQKHPEISSGTFHSIMNVLSKHYLVKRIPLDKRKIAYYKTSDYTIGKGGEILKTHYRKEAQKYRKKTTISKPIPTDRVYRGMGLWKEIGTTPRGRKIWRKHNMYRVQSGHHFRVHPETQLNRIYRVLESSGSYLSTYNIVVKTKLHYGDVQERLYVLMAKGEIKRKLREGKGPGREYIYFLPESKPDTRPWTFVIKLKNGKTVNVHNLNMHGKNGVVFLFNQNWFQRVDVRQIENIEIKRVQKDSLSSQPKFEGPVLLDSELVKNVKN